mmetsp:Transcript_11719/g.43470  ORF Transcript_11719/g.43470 Transcript_11719/m.43470 type:complete len:315 (-) Transcript_11719:2419-3363(-)
MRLKNSDAWQDRSWKTPRVTTPGATRRSQVVTPQRRVDPGHKRGSARCPPPPRPTTTRAKAWEDSARTWSKHCSKMRWRHRKANSKPKTKTTFARSIPSPRLLASSSGTRTCFRTKPNKSLTTRVRKRKSTPRVTREKRKSTPTRTTTSAKRAATPKTNTTCPSRVAFRYRRGTTVTLMRMTYQVLVVMGSHDTERLTTHTGTSHETQRLPRRARRLTTRTTSTKNDRMKYDRITTTAPFCTTRLFWAMRFRKLKKEPRPTGNTWRVTSTPIAKTAGFFTYRYRRVKLRGLWNTKSAGVTRLGMGVMICWRKQS